MLLVNNMSLSFGTQVIFDKVSFTVNSGERVGLVGRNGHGKTTLFNLITKKITQDSGEISTPRLYRVGCLEQNLRFSKNNVLEEALLGLPNEQRQESWQAEKILFGLGFVKEDLMLAPELLSGGFQVRLNLAKVLLSKPDLLLLDEPTNYLDIVAMRWLANFLRFWQGELLLITHDRAFMDSVVTHILGIYRASLQKVAGSTDKYYGFIAEMEDLYERTRVNEAKKRQEMEVFINRFRSKATLATRVQSRIKLLQKKTVLEKLVKPEELEISFTEMPFKARTVLEAEDLSFAYKKNDWLFKNLKLSLNTKERIAIVGRNGKGKSTLLKILARELETNIGSVSWHQNAVCGYFAQTNIETLLPDKTIEDSIWDVDRNQSKQKIRNICGAMMFSGDNALKKNRVLSGGEKTRVLLGQLLLKPLNVLLLDEPTNHLDMDAADALLEAIDAFSGAVIIVTHNEMFLNTLAEKLIVFDEGQVYHFNGTWEEFLNKGGFKENSLIKDEKEAQDSKSNLSPKEERALRAKALQEKNAVLKPLQNKVAFLEKEVSLKEIKIKQLQEMLAEAAMNVQGDLITELSCNLHEENKALEVSYDALLEAMEVLEKEEEKFLTR